MTLYSQKLSEFKTAREKYEWEEAWLDNARMEIASGGYDDPLMAWACLLNYAHQRGEISERMENAPYHKKANRKPKVTVVDRYAKKQNSTKGEWKLRKYGASIYTTR